MADEQKDRYLQHLIKENQELRLTDDAMKLVLEDFMAQMRELKDRMSALESNHEGLQKDLSEKDKLCKSLERKLKLTQEKLDYANKQLYGDRCQQIQSN